MPAYLEKPHNLDDIALCFSVHYDHPICTASATNGCDDYSLRAWLRIEGPAATFTGYTRVLLERIRVHQSICASARSMQMSCRRAWKLGNSINRQSLMSVVVSSACRHSGGGARLADESERAIEAFWSAYQDFRDFSACRTKALRLKKISLSIFPTRNSA
jgi:molybdate transport system regulatory protein